MRLRSNSLRVLLLGSALVACSWIGACGGGNKGSPPGYVDPEVRRALVREYFEQQRLARDAVATTTTASGQVFDWIQIGSQTPDGLVAAPPDPMDGIEQEDDPPVGPLTTEPPELDVLEEQSRLSELQEQPDVLGPPGTVPIAVFNVEAYLASVYLPPEDPQEILPKLAPPSPESNDRYYAVWQRFGAFYGSAGRINIWNTNGPVAGETSIAQVAVIRGSPMQAIEAGKIEYQALNGDLRPHFFTYFRTNGSASGNNVAGYNTLVTGWVQYSTVVAPGMSLIPWESAPGGSQFSVDVEVRIYNGNWWVKVGGLWAGYYPGTLFNAGGIASFADRLDWYGEVYDSSSPSATSTDMGSGSLAATGWRHAAYFRNLTYFWAPSTYWWWNSGSVQATDAACYSKAGPYYSTYAPWRNWFYYGGPGKEGTGCF